MKTAKVTQDVLKGKKETEYSLKALSIMRSQPNRTDFQLLKTKLKAKKTPKQAETEGGCSESLTKYLCKQNTHTKIQKVCLQISRDLTLNTFKKGIMCTKILIHRNVLLKNVDSFNV